MQHRNRTPSVSMYSPSDDRDWPPGLKTGEDGARVTDESTDSARIIAQLLEVDEQAFLRWAPYGGLVASNHHHSG
jgi:hypothetical protein